jgi:hypothetical protein
MRHANVRRSRSMHHSCVRLLMTGFLLVAACEGTTSEECDTSDTTGYLDGRWRSPPLPAKEYVLTNAGNSLTQQRLWFGSDVPQSLATVWWPQGMTDLPVNWACTVGTNEGALRDARLILLVDGSQVRFLNAQAELVDFAPVQIPPGSQGSVDLRIPGASVAPGAHTMVIALESASTGLVDLGITETIIKGDNAAFGSRPDHTSQAILQPSIDGFLLVESAGSFIPANIPLTTITADGTMPLRMQIGPSAGSTCSGTPVPIIVSMLVDFRQVSLEGFGPYARLLLDGAHSAIFDTRAIGLPPPDGTKHIISIIVHQGDGLYSEAPPGTVTGLVARQAISIANGFY